MSADFEISLKNRGSFTNGILSCKLGIISIIKWENGESDRDDTYYKVEQVLPGGLVPVGRGGGGEMMKESE
jgi:hypothetical protein